MQHIPRTTSLTGDDVRASWVVKSEAVTWHSHSPSSNSNVAALTHRLQSPVSWLPAHSYFLVYIPTGCNTRALHYSPSSFVLKPFQKFSKKSDSSGRKGKYYNCIHTRTYAGYPRGWSFIYRRLIIVHWITPTKPPKLRIGLESMSSGSNALQAYLQLCDCLVLLSSVDTVCTVGRSCVLWALPNVYTTNNFGANSASELVKVPP
jgi:hypothetical protein